MQSASDVAVNDSILALAFIGDLSMGRPADHSPRTARLASLLAAEAGGSQDDCVTAHYVSLLRWSGCTANAAGFDTLLGNDVAGRDAMLSQTLPPLSAKAQRDILPLARIHCEVSGDIAAMLGMGEPVETSLRHIFETYDGHGMPGLMKHPEVPAAVYHVALASDLEILGRAHGIDAALAYMSSRADAKYPAGLVALFSRFARQWLAELEAGASPRDALLPLDPAPPHQVSLELIADVVDLKLPWMAGQSRQVAELAQAGAAHLGLDAASRSLIYRAGLIHGIGRAAFPNSLWSNPGKPSVSDWEQIRLMPYWTARAARQIRNLSSEADLASHAYERLDGSGYFRSLSGHSLSVPSRILATAVAWVALRSPRPWRGAHGTNEAAAILRKEAADGRFDPAVVDTVIGASMGKRTRMPTQAAKTTIVLSSRETEVLHRISLGESNKEAARALEISASTVRTHVESIFRKLDCSTRAAATLKAFTMGLL
jgi:HD-GYP domain-containing protein (c-di-GMP phosphodiesterase class II)